MLWDHRPGSNRFAGIVLQEYSPRERRLIGERHVHLQRHADRLHRSAASLQAQRLLLPARPPKAAPAGDTRSRWRARATLTGPVRAASGHVHPDRAPSARTRELQRAGHADLVETQNGETYMVYLCGRPLRNRGRCTLGRETAIQQDDLGRGRLAAHADGDGRSRRSRPPRRPCRRTPFPHAPSREDFDGPQLPIDFQWLRSPWPDELFSLTARPGYLRLFGRETIGSLFRQSLVARRQQAHCFSADDRRGVRAGAFPADGRPGLLLQQHQVPLPLRLARRGAAASTCA